MTLFSSRPPFNDDPEPWRLVGLEEIWDPRPDYDHPQHNPTNPILDYARQHPKSDILWSYLPFRPTGDMIAHARKVLNRLSDLRIKAEVEALFSEDSR